MESKGSWEKTPEQAILQACKAEPPQAEAARNPFCQDIAQVAAIHRRTTCLAPYESIWLDPDVCRLSLHLSRSLLLLETPVSSSGDTIHRASIEGPVRKGKEKRHENGCGMGGERRKCPVVEDSAQACGACQGFTVFQYAQLLTIIQIVYTAIIGCLLLAAFLEWVLWIGAFMYCLWKVFRKSEHWTVNLLAVLIAVAFLLLR